AGSKTDGYADGKALSSRFNFVHGISLDPDPLRATMFVADRFNHCIRRVTFDPRVLDPRGTPPSPTHTHTSAHSALFVSPIALPAAAPPLPAAPSPRRDVRAVEPLAPQPAAAPAAASAAAASEQAEPPRTPVSD